MASNSVDNWFLAYLTCTLPDGYPIRNIPLSFSMKENHRKELIFQQTKFLETAQEFVATHPWVAYLAAIKHEALLNLVSTTSVSFSQIADKEYFDSCQRKCFELRDSAKALTEEAAQGWCQRLIKLQCDGDQLDAAIRQVDAALDTGYTCLDPLPPKPEDYKGGCMGSCVTFMMFFVGGIVCAVIYGMSDDSYSTYVAGGIGAGIVAAVLVGIIEWNLTKGKAVAAGQRAMAWTAMEQCRDKVRDALAGVKTIPADVFNSGLADMDACLKALITIREERQTLEHTYITPFVP